MQVVAPCDANELRSALRQALNDNAPTYIRIGKKGEAKIYPEPPELKIGKSLVVAAGSDVALICAGTLMGEVMRAAEILKEKGISAEVVSMHSIKPLDVDYLIDAQSRFKMIASIEEHGLIGGLGGAISEWRSHGNHSVKHVMFGTPDEFMHEVGSQEYARRKYGLTNDVIVARVIRELNQE
jgi:transketolase